MLRIETFMFTGWLNFSQFLLIQPRDCVVQTMLTYKRRHTYIMPRVYHNEASILLYWFPCILYSVILLYSRIYVNIIKGICTYTDFKAVSSKTPLEINVSLFFISML